MYECLICFKKEIKNVFNYGDHPVCHKFNLKSKNYSLKLGQCNNCGVIQLTNFIPINELIPVYDWIKYKEPEDHLDYLVENILIKYLLSKESKIYGLSDKDSSIINRFIKLGYINSYCFNNNDFYIENKLAGIETIQNVICELPKEFHNGFKKANLLILRHILEHVRKPNLFIDKILKFVKDEGYLLIEVPDYSKAFLNFDYSTIWEEHTMYFTPNSIKETMRLMGLQIIEFENFEYTNENCIVLLVKRKKI